MKLTRRVVQLAFLVLTVAGVFVMQGHAERWCPFGGVEALYGYVERGELTCSLHISNFYILGGVLLMAVLLRRAFCGWVCPVGTVSEWLYGFGPARWLSGRRWPIELPDRVDAALGLLKYPVLGVILYFTWRAGELIFRGFDPCYALISRHGTDITFWAYVVSGALVIGSLIVTVPFCRWLCPLAAVFAPFSRFGLARVRRDEAACSDCGACRRACPMAIPVDGVGEVTAARCTSCMECVTACPTKINALSWGPPRWLGGRWPAPVLVPIVLACVAGAVAMTYALPLPSFVYSRGEAPAQTAVLTLDVRGVNCRHSTQRFFAFITSREDEYRIPGYLRLEAWPNPAASTVRITYDPAVASEETILDAITTPTFDQAGRSTPSPYRPVERAEADSEEPDS
ncbi:MAG: 4Fe-4S binding protein [Planctomycetota bacterium]